MNALSPPRGYLVINVELDDRSFLFPDGKTVSHAALREEGDRVRIDGVFHFNESRQDTLIQTLDVDDAREFARAVVEAVSQGRTQHVLSDAVRIAVIFNPNGFMIRFGEGRAMRELFVNSPAVLRLAQGVLRLADRMSAPPAH